MVNHLEHGFQFAAIVGKNKVMNASKKTFISSTFGQKILVL